MSDQPYNGEFQSLTDEELMLKNLGKATPKIVNTLVNQLDDNDNRTAREAAVKLADFMQKNGLIPKIQEDLPPVTFRIDHLDAVVEGMLHFARWGGLEKQFPKEQVASALTYMTRPE